MKKLVSAGLALAMVLGTSAIFAEAADAKPWKKRVNVRQKAQKNRIKHGVKCGTLNKKEAKRLKAQQKSLNKMEQRFRRSGNGLTPKEARILEQRQDNMSKRIYNQKRDGQNRY